MLYQFERDVRGDAAGGQFREGGDILLISSPIAIVSKHDGRSRGFLPTAPVVANAFRLGTPAAQRILLEAIRVLETEPIALFVVVIVVVGICVCVCILLLRIVAIVVVVVVAVVCSIVVAVTVVGSAAARTIPLLDGPSSSPIRLRPILITGSSSPATSAASSTCFLLLVAIVPLVVVLMLLLLRMLPLWWPLRATPSSVRSVCQLRLS